MLQVALSIPIAVHGCLKDLQCAGGIRKACCCQFGRCLGVAYSGLHRGPRRQGTVCGLGQLLRSLSGSIGQGQYLVCHSVHIAGAGNGADLRDSILKRFSRRSAFHEAVFKSVQSGKDTGRSKDRFQIADSFRTGLSELL